MSLIAKLYCAHNCFAQMKMWNGVLYYLLNWFCTFFFYWEALFDLTLYINHYLTGRIWSERLIRKKQKQKKTHTPANANEQTTWKHLKQNAWVLLLKLSCQHTQSFSWQSTAHVSPTYRTTDSPRLLITSAEAEQANRKKKKMVGGEGARFARSGYFAQSGLAGFFLTIFLF